MDREAQDRHAAPAPSRYQAGFANHVSTESVPGALPLGQNSPQKPPLGLYAEQISGTAFTAPRHENRRSWLYRLRPSAGHPPYRPHPQGLIRSGPFTEAPADPNRLRWNPIEIGDDAARLRRRAGDRGGERRLWRWARGWASTSTSPNCSMQGRVFYDADGELLLVPQDGRLSIFTELGVLELSPGEMGVIPRGVKFRVELLDGTARGYVCENYGALFRLPELGPDRLQRPRQSARFPDPRRRL